MEERLQNLQTKIKEIWEETSTKRKIAYGVGLLLIVLILVFGIRKLTETKYELLYGDLSLSDVAEITTKLDELNIEWKSGDNQTSVLVPEDQKNKAKIELANLGLPKDGYSFSDAFEESSWTMTDYDKKQRMKQALQTELALTISDIEGIDSAKVYIEDTEQTNFVLSNDDTKTTASVFVVKDPSESLNNDKVITIKNLVAGAINAKPEDVIITDNDGRLLDGVGDNAHGDGTQFKIKSEIENKINDSIRKFLGNVYGYENVDVLASVKINMDSEQTRVVEFSPPVEDSEEGLIRSLEESEEHMVGGQPGGPPGVDANPNEAEDNVLEEDTADRYDRASRIINNELNEINREIRKAPGQVESITVAVLLNESSLPGGEMTAENEEDITDLIYAATGLDTENVKVIAEEFTSGMDGVEEEEEGFKINWIVIAIIIGLIAVGIGLFIYLRKKREEEELAIEEAMLEERMREEIETDILDDDFSFEQEESQMKRQIDKFIDEKPEAVTQLLRNWLNE